MNTSRGLNSTTQRQRLRMQKTVFIAKVRYTGDQSIRLPKQTRSRQGPGQDTKLGQVHVESDTRNTAGTLGITKTNWH